MATRIYVARITEMTTLLLSLLGLLAPLLASFARIEHGFLR